MTIRVVQIRIVPRKGDLEGNFALLARALAGAARARPDVVVTPECFLDGYVATEAAVTRAALRRYAVDPSSSPYPRWVASWAARHRCWVVLGCTRRSPHGPRNSALIYDRSGALVGAYDKTHCQEHDAKFVPGDALPVFASDFGPFGVMICADRRWPETVRTLAMRGARIIFNPTYGMHGDLNLAMMRTRSYESEVFIAFTHPRQSLITGPAGEVLRNDRSAARRFVTTAVPLEQVDRVRASPRGSHLRDRRPELYAG